ncbi:ethylene-responsive transcription factor win1-like protein, partial [Trifolium pratense]
VNAHHSGLRPLRYVRVSDRWRVEQVSRALHGRLARGVFVRHPLVLEHLCSAQNTFDFLFFNNSILQKFFDKASGIDVPLSQLLQVKATSDLLPNIGVWQQRAGTHSDSNWVMRVELGGKKKIVESEIGSKEEIIDGGYNNGNVADDDIQNVEEEEKSCFTND